MEKYHKGEKIVSNKHYKMVYNDEMKNKENCQNIEEIQVRDENVSNIEMQMNTELKEVKVTLEKPQCPICNVKFSENRNWRDKLIKVNWKSNLERHIQNFHREAKIVSKVTVDDEMKDEEKCQNIEEIPATDENVSDNEMQMDTDTRAEIQMDTDTRAEMQMDTDTRAKLQMDTDTRAGIQMDTNTRTEIQMDTDTKTEMQMDTDKIAANQGNLLSGIDNKTVRGYGIDKIKQKQFKKGDRLRSYHPVKI